MTSGFYKLDGGLLFAPNWVLNSGYELRREMHDTYALPIDGWHWFDDETQAWEFFGLPHEKINAE